MSRAESDPLIGKVLNGRFEIVAPLGAGKGGRVYRAVQRPLDRDVAVKVLDPRLTASGDPEFEERFFHEALLTAKLKHPNTVTIHDYGRTEEGIYFIAMELVEGLPLQRLLVERGPMPWRRALSVGTEVARSLGEAHRLGLVHGNLSTANIMLRMEGSQPDHIKVLDYGLAKRSDGPAYRVGPTKQLELTAVGAMMGSFLYTAPERARNVLDARGDIYSLGAVLFMCIAGRTPFVGSRPVEVLARLLREVPPQLQAFAEIPDDVNALVMKCLQRVPEARFADVEQLMEAMRSAARQGLTPTGPIEVPAPPRPERVSAPLAVAPPPLRPTRWTQRLRLALRAPVPALLSAWRWLWREKGMRGG